MSGGGESARQRPALRVALVAADPIRHQGLMAIIHGGGHAVVEDQRRPMSSSSRAMASTNMGRPLSPWAERMQAGHYPQIECPGEVAGALGRFVRSEVW